MRLVALLFLAAALPAGAQTPGKPPTAVLAFAFGTDVGRHQAATADPEGYVGITMGLVSTIGPVMLRADGEVLMTAAAGASSRYYWDNNVDRCRDGQTGRFASSGLCGGAVGTGMAGLAEAHFMHSRSGLHIGPGVRVTSSDLSPYVAAGWGLGTSIMGPGFIELRGAAGARHFSFGARLQLPIAASAR